MSGCIEVTGSRFKQGYGHVKQKRFGVMIYSAHRLAWIDANGRLPRPGMCICHTCDNPPCINPEHLWEGTQAQNLADMYAKGHHSHKNKTHCPQGHAYSDENTYHLQGKRYCRACNRAYQSRKYWSRKLELAA